MHERGHECSSPSSHWQLWIWCESLAQSRFTVTLCLVDTALGNRCVLDWPGPCMRSRLWSHWQSNNKDKAPDCWTLEHWSTSLTRRAAATTTAGVVETWMTSLSVRLQATVAKEVGTLLLLLTIYVIRLQAEGREKLLYLHHWLVNRWCPLPSKTQYCFNMKYCVLRCYTTWPLTTEFVWPWRQIILRTWQILSCCYRGKGGHSTRQDINADTLDKKVGYTVWGAMGCDRSRCGWNEEP